ncbi:MAG: SbcC/MukB-like Walker B domain-containing protein [Eubacteriales bacterium]|nr:SbcC/MukB-like Walker B domain-containing protein [Eubacteriales bacterium]
MKPIRLIMEAFGSYGQRTVIDFTEPNQNLFLVTGDTGAGKTTIFDAVVFALYGGVSGSESGKTDGSNLQSQFADPGVKPFAELVFSEGSAGGGDTIYTVYRQPRYLRPKKRGQEGLREEKEKVSLTLPDGTEFPEKLAETNRKIEEIVGLSREQFLQVGMIAQGEFMRMLRAESKEKKEIFRKLFGTSVFQKVTDELRERKKEAEDKLAQRNIELRSEAGHLRIRESLIDDEPEFPEDLPALIRRVQQSDGANPSDFEKLSEALPILHKAMARKIKEQAESVRLLQEKQKAARDAYVQGRDLEGRFLELENCVRNYQALRLKFDGMTQKRDRLEKADAAWEIQAEYRSWNDEDQEIRKYEQALEETKRKIPPCREKVNACSNASEEAKKRKEKADSVYSEQKKSFEQSQQLFAELRAEKTKIDSLSRTRTEKEEAFRRMKGAYADFEAEERQKNETVRALSGAGAKAVSLDMKIQRVEELQEEASNILRLNEEYTEVRERERNAKEAYRKAAEQFSSKDDQHRRLMRMYLDAQAGILARGLRPGVPCPVCGSISHPSPHILEKEVSEITQESLERLSKEASALDKAQQEASKTALRLRTDREQREETLRDRTGKFRKDLTDFGVDPCKGSEALAEKKSVLQKEKVLAEKERREWDAAREFLEKSEERKAALRSAEEEAGKAREEAGNALSKEIGALRKLEEKKEFPSEDAARKALSEAESRKESADRSAKDAGDALQKASKRLTELFTLETQYTSLLPDMREEREKRRRKYESVRAKKGLSEEEWVKSVKETPRSVLKSLRKEVQDYREQWQAAQASLRLAKKAVAGREKPDVPKLKEKSDRLEGIWGEARKTLDGLRSDDAQNEETRKNYERILETRKMASEQAVMVAGLYQRLSGQVTGGRMDLETFAQRYYLERILRASNRRLLDMTDGEYEFRMVPAAEAGKGKNRGLDLLVFSHLTGKKREIGTLSGGESFMAALSLALGMADQIQESAAGIHLDMMFIDEGFGSLDDHSREQAVRVLQRMAGKERLIGIISHVSELKQEIEDQLIVTKDDAGSHVRWQIS